MNTSLHEILQTDENLIILLVKYFLRITNREIKIFRYAIYYYIYI